jgi:hypothetical protein
MLLLDHESITKGGVHFTPNPLYTCKHTARYTSDFFNQALAASTGPRHFGLY